MAYFTYRSKQIYYGETGSGPPVIFLHGNTASSKMFELLLPLYQGDYNLILIDFLGNGQSDRVDRFADELWYDEGMQVIALIEHLGYRQAFLIGTSGGAWAAINAALERPDLIAGVVADSFDGRTLHPGFGAELVKDREFAARDQYASQFYQWCQGDGWEEVVRLDTEAVLRYESLHLPLFHKPLTELTVPILLMGSKKDDMVRKDLEDEYKDILCMVSDGRIHLFEEGGHPALLTSAETAAPIILDFFASLSCCR